MFCSVTLQRIASFTPSRVFGSSIAGVAEGAPEGVSGVEELGSLSGVEASSSSGSICCTLPYDDIIARWGVEGEYVSAQLSPRIAQAARGAPRQQFVR